MSSRPESSPHLGEQPMRFERPPLVRKDERRSVRDGRLAAGSLACTQCDAPLAPGPAPLAITAALTCPFCGRSGAVRDFLSLLSPTRPAHVVLWLALEPRLA